jgi:hypothetical protein
MHVLDVVDGLLEQDAHVRVVQGVDDASAAPLARHETEVTQYAQLMRDSRQHLFTVPRSFVAELAGDLFRTG